MELRSSATAALERRLGQGELTRIFSGSPSLSLCRMAISSSGGFLGGFDKLSDGEVDYRMSRSELTLPVGGVSRGWGPNCSRSGATGGGAPWSGSRLPTARGALLASTHLFGGYREWSPMEWWSLAIAARPPPSEQVRGVLETSCESAIQTCISLQPFRERMPLSDRIHRTFVHHKHFCDIVEVCSLEVEGSLQLQVGDFLFGFVGWREVR